MCGPVTPQKRPPKLGRVYAVLLWYVNLRISLDPAGGGKLYSLLLTQGPPWGRVKRGDVDFAGGAGSPPGSSASLSQVGTSGDRIASGGRDGR